MKSPTKTVVNRGGGIAARFAPPETKAKPVAKVANVTVANPKPVANVANQPRYAKWREANPELWLERQRAAQKRYRAKKQAEKQG